jgi:hypothetical protein
MASRLISGIDSMIMEDAPKIPESRIMASIIFANTLFAARAASNDFIMYISLF